MSKTWLIFYVTFACAITLPVSAFEAASENEQFARAPEMPPTGVRVFEGDNQPENIAKFQSFQGDCDPSSYVELARNGLLIGAEMADESGHYSFKNVPVLYGKNVFKTSMESPRGVYQEHDQSVDIPYPIADAQKNQPPTALHLAAPPVAPPASVSGAAGSVVSSGPAASLVANTGDVGDSAPPEKNQSILSEATPALGDDIILALVHDRTALGVVPSYIDKQNIYVSIKTVLMLVGVSYQQDVAQDSLDISLDDHRNIVLNFAKNEYVVDGDHNQFYANDIFRKDGEVYGNIELLNRILPQIGLVVNLSFGQISVNKLNQPVADDGTLAPAPSASPVVPVIIDNAVDQQIGAAIGNQPPNEAEEAHDVVHLTTTDEGKGAPRQSPQGEGAAPVAIEKKEDEEETLILQPLIKNLPPSDVFIESFKLGGQLYIPFNDVVQLFGFSIVFNKATNTYSGFFLTSANTFSLDVAKHTVRVRDQSRDVSDADLRIRQDQVYVSTKSFAEWFGINTELDTSKLTLHFVTDSLLPQEEEAERQKRWTALLNAVEKSDKDYPVLENPYHAFGYPSFDVNLGELYTRSSTPGSSSGSSFQSSYNIQGEGDLGYLTSKVYAQGLSTGTGIDTFRFQAGRVDPNAQLLGGLHATEFEFGDVTSPSLSLVTTNALGRGAVVTNRDVNASENFDFHNFTGDATPGYQVEIYRNDVLLAFQTVDSTGRYNFQNIPVLYGENIFRIVLYGQQGQREERVETISPSASLLKAGQTTYSVGLDQRGESFIPIAKNDLANATNPVGMEGVSDFHYGISNDVTVGAALAQTRLADGDHQYAQASTNVNLFGILTEADLAQDLAQKGWAASASALGGFDDVSVRMRYRKFNNFSSEAINNITSPLTSDASLDAETQFYLPVLGSYSTGLSALHETYVDPLLKPQNTYSWRSSKSLWGISYTDSIDYVTGNDPRLQDTFGLQTRFFNTDFRAVGITDMQPDQRLREVSFMADYYLDKKLSGETSIDRNLLGNQDTYGQSVNWDFDDFRLSLLSQMTDSKNYSLGLNVLFSINHDPVTNAWRTQSQQSSDSGAISGRVYVADTKDGSPEEDRPNYTEAKVRVNKVLVVPNPDDFFAAPVAPYQVNKVELDTTTIADPLLTPVNTGYKVMTRPGDNVVVDFPMVHTTIIDGVVSFMDEKGEKRVLGDVVVELDNSDGKPIKRVLSAIDGYFSFDKVPVGNYTLSVPQEALTAINAVLDTKPAINIDKIDQFMTGNEVILHQDKRLDVPPPVELPHVEPPSTDGQRAPPPPAETLPPADAPN